MDSAAKPPLLVLCGPTASGKSALALLLAEALDGEVVSADSMQLYRGLDIATAKPSAEEQARVRHHMIDILEAEQTFSAAEYQRLARECVADIHARGKLPVVAGGTGLFLDALTCPLDFAGTRGDPEERARWETLLHAQGAEALHARLREADPESAARLHPNDTRRVIRALEVAATGKAMGQSRLELRKRSPYALCMIALQWPRAELYARIHARIEAMREAGLVEEARRVYDMRLPAHSTALQSIGYKEFFPYFAGERTEDEAFMELETHTRQYAKRQETWFRRDARVQWYPCGAAAQTERDAETLPAAMLQYASQIPLINEFRLLYKMIISCYTVNKIQID